MAKIYETEKDIQRDMLTQAVRKQTHRGDLGIFQTATGVLVASIPFGDIKKAKKIIAEVAPNSNYGLKKTWIGKIGIALGSVLAFDGMYNIVSAYKNQTKAERMLEQLGHEEVVFLPNTTVSNNPTTAITEASAVEKLQPTTTVGKAL